MRGWRHHHKTLKKWRGSDEPPLPPIQMSPVFFKSLFYNLYRTARDQRAQTTVGDHTHTHAATATRMHACKHMHAHTHTHARTCAYTECGRAYAHTDCLGASPPPLTRPACR